MNLDNNSGDEHDAPHVLPVSVYLGVWVTLVVLTGLTVFVSRFDFGSANTVIALAVATIKAAIVALFFMHLLYDDKFNLVVLLTSMLFLTVFFTPTLIDLSSRGMVDPIKSRAGFKWVAAKRSEQPPPPPDPARVLPIPAPAAAVAPASAEATSGAPAGSVPSPAVANPVPANPKAAPAPAPKAAPNPTPAPTAPAPHAAQPH